LRDMLTAKCYLPIFMLFLALPLQAQTRSFDTIFPGLPPEIRKSVFSNNGYLNEGFLKSENAASAINLIGNSPNGLTPGITGKVTEKFAGKKTGKEKETACVVESLLVIPGKRDLLAVYNALGRIRNLKGLLYQSHSRGTSVPLFEEATRLESAKKITPVPDPAPASTIPESQTVYVRLKDTNFGNSFYRGDMVLENKGLTFSLTNFRNISFMLVPVIKEEKFIAQLYFEVIDEGILVYSIAGAEVSDFVASKIDIPSAIRKRLSVLISWVTDGLKK